MVSAARRKRAWILLLAVWVVIAGVLAWKYVDGRRNAAAQLDREAREQEALRAMDKMDPPPPLDPPPAAAPEPTKPEPDAVDPAAPSPTSPPANSPPANSPTPAPPASPS